jgi:hypothetical protein
VIDEQTLLDIEIELKHHKGRSYTMTMPTEWVQGMIDIIRSKGGLLNSNGFIPPAKKIMLSACRFCGSAPEVKERSNYIFIECLHLNGEAGTCVGGKTIDVAASHWNLMQKQ